MRLWYFAQVDAAYLMLPTVRSSLLSGFIYIYIHMDMYAYVYVRICKNFCTVFRRCFAILKHFGSRYNGFVKVFVLNIKRKVS